MKKIISVLLCIAVAVSTCAFAATSAVPEDDLGFAVASDMHISLPEPELTKTNDDSLFWHANRRAAMDNESSYIMESFLNQCAADESVDFVLISGDLADSGRNTPEEHELAAEKLLAFEKKSGKEVYVICGNHDLGNNSKTGMKEFKSYYAELGYDHALAQRENDCSYTANLGKEYRLIALDSTNYDKSTSDGMTNDKLAWVKEQTAQAKKDGRYPILMMHHNLLEHLPMQPIISKDFIIKNHLPVAEQFANQGIKLVFTGHEHCSDTTSYTSAKGNTITDFATTALSMYPLEYRVFSITDDTITYSTKKVESIDTAAVSKAVKGYTPEMLAAMDSDLNAFAKGYLKAGIQYRLALSLSDEKLGIEPDAIYYGLVKKVIVKLTDILDMPFYGENGLQALAAEYNIAIPDSNYKNGWDLATEIVAAHYAGSENYSLESTEITALLRLAAVLLREEFSGINDTLFLGAANAILDSIGVRDSMEKLCKSIFGRVTPVEKLLIAIVSPLLLGFSSDSDGVDDNNGTLTGYVAASAENNIVNMGKNFASFFEKIINYMSIILKYVLRAVMI